MSKILVFAIAAQPRGGVGDLRVVLETDNQQGIKAVDKEGYLLPEQLHKFALLWGRPAAIDALHLNEQGLPVRMERWEKPRIDDGPDKGYRRPSN